MEKSQKIFKFGIWGIAALSFIGVADSGYLSAKYIRGEVPECGFFSGCDVVANSAYSHIGPVPVAVLGLVFYLAIFALTIAYLDNKSIKWIKLISVISMPAFAFSLWLMYVQLFILGSICVYCTVSAFLSTSIAIISNLLAYKLRKS